MAHLRILAPVLRGPSRRRLYALHSRTSRCQSTLSDPKQFLLPTAPSTRYISPTHRIGGPSSGPVLARSSRYLLPVYDRPPLVLSHGKGLYVWDLEGQKFLDFSAGIAVNALSHSDDEFIKALSDQAQKLLHTSNIFNHEWAGKLAELLVTLTQQSGGLGWAKGQADASQTGAKVFFSNSGTEANEAALKVARSVGKEWWALAVPGRPKNSAECPKVRIACFENAFHGRTMGALSVTPTEKYQRPFTPLIPGVDVGKLNDLEGLRTLVGPDTCAVIVEPIQGEGGIHTAQEEWLRALRRRCYEVGAVLIFDEIQCGLYRSGTMWAHSSFPTDCHPDIVTMAKPLANGYPVGAVMLRDSVVSTMTAGTHGTTFGGSPLACALGHHVLNRLAKLDGIADSSGYLIARLELLAKWFPDIVEAKVRGRGLILGLGFYEQGDPERVMKLARERGLFVLTAGKDALRLVPSLNVQREHVDMAVDVLEGCLAVLQREKSGTTPA